MAKKRKKLSFSIKLLKARETILKVKKVADEAVATGTKVERSLRAKTDLKSQLQHAGVENALLRAVKAQQALDSAHKILFDACCNQVHNCDPDYS